MAELRVVQVAEHHHPGVPPRQQPDQRGAPREAPRVERDELAPVVLLEPAEAVGAPVRPGERGGGVVLLRRDDRVRREEGREALLAQQLPPAGGAPPRQEKADPGRHVRGGGPHGPGAPHHVHVILADHPDGVADAVVRHRAVGIGRGLHGGQAGVAPGHPERVEEAAAKELLVAHPRGPGDHLARQPVHQVLVDEATPERVGGREQAEPAEDLAPGHIAAGPEQVGVAEAGVVGEQVDDAERGGHVRLRHLELRHPAGDRIVPGQGAVVHQLRQRHGGHGLGGGHDAVEGVGPHRPRLPQLADAVAAEEHHRVVAHHRHRQPGNGPVGGAVADVGVEVGGPGVGGGRLGAEAAGHAQGKEQQRGDTTWHGGFRGRGA